MKKENLKNMMIPAIVTVIVLLAVFLALGLMKLYSVGPFAPKEYPKLGEEEIEKRKPDIDVQLLSMNEYSRPGTAPETIRGIVIHYTANPGSTAQNNRDYFEGLKTTHQTSVSSHFVVGLDGEIIQCVPTWEMAYASNERNVDTISIECCHPDETGKFNGETYRSVVELVAWLCMKFDLTEKDVIRHYDVTGKECPRYFVRNEEAWDAFRKDVRKELYSAGFKK